MTEAAPVTDPFLNFEQKLASKGYRNVGWKDVLDRCDFRDRKSGQEVRLDRDRLQKIADFRNKLVAERESVAHFCLGHTKDDAPEWEQPPVVGLASRWRVGQYANGEPNLEAYSWENPGRSGVFDEYPQRSAELWLTPDDVNPIALLASTTPRRNLSHRLSARLSNFDDPETTSSGRSVVRFWRHNDPGRHPILFEMRAEDMGPNDNTVSPTSPDDEEFDAKLDNSASTKDTSAKLDKILSLFEKFAPVMQAIIDEETGGMEGPDGPGAGPGGPPPGAVPPPGPGGPAGAGLPPGAGPAAGPGGPPPGAEPPLPDRDDGPVKKNMAGGSPGYGNTAMPHYMQADSETRIRMQRLESANASLMRQVADRDARERALTEQVKALQFARVNDEVTATVDALEREGYTVVREIDQPWLCGLDPKAREKAVQFMRETRAKKDVTPVPGGGTEVVDPAKVLMPLRFDRREDSNMAGDPSLTPGGAAELTSADYARIAAEARAKGVNPLHAYKPGAITQQANGTATAVR